jgi:CRP-like cAMP-binding protein
METLLAAPDLRPRLRLLAASRLFAALPESCLHAIAGAMTERIAECGEAIFLQSDPGSALFAVIAGQVRILVGGADGREHVLRLAGPGDIFGEIAVLDSQPRSADAIAVTNCRLLVLERRRLLALLEQQPAIAINLLAVLCDRLRATSAQVEGLLFHSLPSTSPRPSSAK